MLIESAGTVVVRLFLESREQVAEFDAATEETTQMMAGLHAQRGALGAEWDAALAGHSVSERGAASVFTLDV